MDVVGFRKSFILVGVSVDNDCTKRGQTSRPVVGTQIQTSCNLKANLHDRYCILGRTNCFFGSVILEFPHNCV